MLFNNIYTDKFLNIVSDSIRLFNRIYGGNRITSAKIERLGLISAGLLVH